MQSEGQAQPGAAGSQGGANPSLDDPFGRIEAALEHFDGSAEHLKRIRGALAEIAASAREADCDDLLSCARLLSEVAAIIGCDESGPEPGRVAPDSAEAADDWAGFLQSGLKTLRAALDEQPGAGEQISQLQDEARRRWGDYLDLLESDEPATGEVPEGESAEEESFDAQNAPGQVDLILSNLASRVGEAAAGGGPGEDADEWQQMQAAGRNERPTGDGAASSPRHAPGPSGRNDVSPSAIPAPPAPRSGSDMDEELLEAYLDDAQGGLASMEQAVLAFETDPESPEALGQICRELHTLKGASASVGLSELAHYLHEVEDFLESRTEKPADAVDAESLLQVVDAVRSQVSALQSPDEASRPFSGSDGPQADAPGSRGQPSSTPASAAKVDDSFRCEDRPARPVSGPAKRHADLESAPRTGGLEVRTEDSVRVQAVQLDRLMDLLAELIMLRNRRDSQVALLKQINEELNRCASRVRIFTDDFAGSPAGDLRATGVGETALCHGPPSLALARPKVSRFTNETSGQFDGGFRSYGANKGLAKSFAQPSVDRSPGNSAGHRTTSLTEIANDIAEVGRSLRDLYEPVAEENRAVSRFIRQFRQELAEMRRQPVSGLFRRLQRAARDAARAEDKKVTLQLLGEHAGLERSLQERLYEPLLHLVRNAVSHGIESAEERAKAGKNPVGTVTLEARGGPSLLLLEIRDDGRGLDYEALRRRGLERGLISPDRSVSRDELARLMFQPGFSTKESAGAISGRGVGMDVVAAALDRMHARIEVESEPGQGTTIRLTIPLRSVIEHAMLFRSAGRVFALPMQWVQTAGVGGAAGEPDFPTLRLCELLGQQSRSEEHPGQMLVLADREPTAAAHTAENGEPRAEGEDRAAQGGHGASGSNPPSSLLPPRSSLGLLVEEIIGPEEVVVRPLPPLLKRHRLLAGLTLSGTGEMVLVFAGDRLIELARRRANRSGEPAGGRLEGCGSGAPAETGFLGQSSPRRPSAPKVLVVDDSLSARKNLVQLLKQKGFDVTEAGDGFEALERVRAEEFRLVFTDLEMPRLGGLELLSELKSGRRTSDLPAVVVSSRGEEEFQTRARQLGAVDYLVKPVSDRDLDGAFHRLRAPNQPRVATEESPQTD